MKPRSLHVSFLLALAFLAWSASGQLPGSPGEGERPKEAQAALRAAMQSPRATVRTFFEAMQAVKAGNDSKLLEAVRCIYLGEGLSDEDALNQGSPPAHTIFSVMEGLQFNLESISDAPEGTNYTAKLGDSEYTMDLYLHRYEENGLWRISSRSLEPAYLETLAAQAAAMAGAAPANASQYVQKYRSPRATLEAFIKGMNAADGFTLEDAVAALDLSAIDAADRAAVGASKAADLKAVIDRIKPVEFTEIPPESAGDTYVYYQDPAGAGSIVLAPVSDISEPELRAWRFTKGTLDRLESLYLKFKDRPLVQGLQSQPEARPWANRIRDWTYNTYPGLMASPLYLRNYQWLGLLLLIGCGIVISRLLTLVMGLFIRYWFRRKGYEYDKVLEQDFIRPIRITLMAWVWLYGLTLLGLNPDVLKYLRVAAYFVTVAGAVWASYRLIDLVGKYLTEHALKSESKYDDLLVPILVRTLKVFVVVAGIVAFAYQFDDNPTSLLTGLGLGGLAFALAAKDVVANVFGSLTILMDRPFRIGDWVTIGDIDGNVESVGIRSTRIRTFYNSLITVPNSAITNTHVDNMGCRSYRRIKTTLGIAYNTPPDSIDAFCEGIRELIRRHPYTRKDYYHVYLNDFGESSLNILLYCFVQTPEWGTELRERHRLLADILRLANELHVEFAFPTRTLYMREEQTPEPRGMEGSAQDAGRAAAKHIILQSLDGTTIPPPVDFRMPKDQINPDTRGM